MNVLDGPYCGWCGELCADRGHEGCAGRAALEPPRYCAKCGRRMMVQVLPTGWSARCSRHGEVEGG